MVVTYSSVHTLLNEETSWRSVAASLRTAHHAPHWTVSVDIGEVEEASEHHTRDVRTHGRILPNLRFHSFVISNMRVREAHP